MWTWLLVLTARTRELFSKKSSDQDFDEELRSHFDMLVDRHMQRGMAPDDARREARLPLGGGLQLAEMHRERRSFPVIDTLVQDVRYAVRGFRRSPSFTLVAVVTLALGIGANTTMYSVVHATILRRLPYADPDRLMKVSLVTPAFGAQPGNEDMAWSYLKYEAFSRLQDSFELTALFRQTQQSLTGTDPERLVIEQVGAGYFPTLGAQAVLGRTLRPDEDSPQQNFVAVLSDGLWKRRFGGDPGVIGRTVELDQRPYTIIGVMPPDFRALSSGPIDAWTSVHSADADDLEYAEAHSFRMVARLRDGVSPASASAAIVAAGTALDRMFAGPNRGWSASGAPRRHAADSGHPASRAGAVRGRRPRAADHVRQHGQPAARSRHGAAARAVDPALPRRGTRPADAAAADGEHRAGDGRRGRGSPRRVGRRAGARRAEPNRRAQQRRPRPGHSVRAHGARVQHHQAGRRRSSSRERPRC